VSYLSIPYLFIQVYPAEAHPPRVTFFSRQHQTFKRWIFLTKWAWYTNTWRGTPSWYYLLPNGESQSGSEELILAEAHPPGTKSSSPKRWIILIKWSFNIKLQFSQSIYINLSISVYLSFYFSCLPSNAISHPSIINLSLQLLLVHNFVSVFPAFRGGFIVLVFSFSVGCRLRL
jgi:hypothetical protein